MTGTWRLDTLPSDVLILIFDYCHAFDLVRLSHVCTRFLHIVRDETLWIKKSKQPLVTNQATKRFRDRCNSLLCLRTRWHVSQNWQKGRYEKKHLFSQRLKLMPWLQMTKDVLWWSGGYQLCGYKRTKAPTKTYRIFSEDKNRGDICKFIVREDYIVSGHRNGSINIWTTASVVDHFYCGLYTAHSTDVNAVDQSGNSIISGDGNGIVKIWNWDGETIANVPSTTLHVSDRVLSLAVDPTGTKFAVGSTGNSAAAPLRIFDMECCDELNISKHGWRRGAGILDMVWDSPNILLTCGYDTYIKKWDLRTGTVVSAWPDPTDATLYCISSDYQYTMLTGTQYNCKAVLWDQRQKGYIQLYFMHMQSTLSPVYCIAFDNSHLYGATDQHVVELTFSGYSYKENDYRKILGQFWSTNQNRVQTNRNALQSG